MWGVKEPRMTFRLVIFLTLVLGLALIWAIGHRTEEVLSYSVPAGYAPAVAISKPVDKPFVSALEYAQNLAPEAEVSASTPSPMPASVVATAPHRTRHFRVLRKHVAFRKFRALRHSRRAKARTRSHVAVASARR